MQTNQMVRNLITRINNMLGANGDFVAVLGREGKPKTMPIDKVYVVLSTDENAVAFFEDDNSECCKRTNLKIGIDFIVPSNVSAVKAYETAETILDKLSAAEAGKLTSYSLGEFKSDNDLKSMRIEGVLNYEFSQCPAYGEGGEALLPYTDFFCKSHVNDKVVHVTQEDKDLWSELFVTGTYTGDGADEQFVALTFKPKFVLVYESNAAVWGTQNGMQCSTVAFGFASHNSMGLQVNNNGFTVKQGSKAVSMGVYVMLNSAGKTYNYIAFR